MLNELLILFTFASKYPITNEQSNKSPSYFGGAL
jgi:hypothetical protein